MNFIRSFMRKELGYFDKLDIQGKNLIKSYAVSGIADPILYTFINAFIWGASGSLITVALYNLGFYLGLPVGFYVNGLLFKYIQANKLYLFGAVSQGVIVFLLIFLSISSQWQVLLFGILYGFGSSFFWANRNFLTLKVTTTGNRMYFSSLESLSGILTSIIIPILVGWFIVAGENFNLYTRHQGYQMTAFIAMLSLFAVGCYIRNVNVEFDEVKKITLNRASNRWKKFRLFTGLDGFVNGLSLFLPVVILLHFTQSEGAVGTVKSFAALISAGVVYYFSRFIDVKHRFKILIIGFALSAVGALIFGLTYSPIGMFALFIGAAFAAPFQWAAVGSVEYDIIDEEEKVNPDHHYAFVFDSELFLNIGRYIAIAFFLLLTTFFTTDSVIRFSPLIFISLQVVQVLIIRSIDPHAKG